MRRNTILNMNLVFMFFLSFINYLSASTCNFDVKVKLVLRNEGFHRNITYGIVFNSESEGERHLYRGCILGLDQTLPPGLYANPDELSDFKRTQRLNAIPKNRVNIELPAEQSYPSSVLVIGRVTDSKVNLWMPVHARYHRAVPGGGTARNEIEPPKLYLRCPDQRLDVCDKAVSPSVTFLCNGSSKEKCSWKEIPYTTMTDALIWHVPVGNTDHYYTVAIGTGVAVTVGSLYLLKSIHEYAVAVRTKRL